MSDIKYRNYTITRENYFNRFENIISTGAHSDYYTLWRSHIFACKGFATDTCNFVQNLAKEADKAYEKALELGYEVTPEDFTLKLRHDVKHHFRAFGEEFSEGSKMYFTSANHDFFEAWKADKESLKAKGWRLWKSQDGEWFMGISKEITASEEV